MRLIPTRLWLLVLASALLQLIPFPIAGPVSGWRAAFAWICLIPLLYALLQPAKDAQPLSLKQAAALGYLAGIAWYMGNCYWIYQTMYLYGGLPKPVAIGILCLFALYLGLYHAFFAVVLVAVRRSKAGISGALLSTPFIWVAVELARSRITGFPWDLLGNSLIDNLFVTRLAPIAGVLSISFLLVAINSALTSFFYLRSFRRIAIPVSAVTFVLVCEVLGSLPAAPFYPTHTAVLLQENLEVGAPGKEIKPLTREQELDQFSQWSLHPEIHRDSDTWISAPTKIDPEIVVWPEAPSHLISSDADLRSRLGEAARAANSPLIAGSLGVDYSNSSPRGYYLYDSATLFDKSGTYQGRYDKIHLVPWGEYIPYKEFFAFAHKLTEGAGDMDRGQTRSVFPFSGHTYGIFICYESIFGNEVREFVHNGAQVLVNISDDGWYGDTGAPWQHLNMTRMRAIENHRWLLLDTNTGITTAIDPLGRMAFQAPRHVRAAFVFPFDFTTGETFYTRHGDWFAWLCCLVTLIFLGLNLKLRIRLK